MERGYWVHDWFGPVIRFDSADAAWAFVTEYYPGRAWVTFQA